MLDEREREKERRWAEQREIERIRKGTRSVNSGYSEEGFNFGLGEYIKNRDHYKRVLKEKMEEDPDLEPC